MANLKRLISCVAIVALVLAGGCKSSNGTSAAADEAVMCPKCETVWVRTPQAIAGGKATAYVSARQMKCPDCESAVSNFVKTGTLAHACKHCGETLAHCESHTKVVEGAAAVKSNAVTCPKCKTTWVKQAEQATTGRTTVTVFKDKATKTCASCEKAAENYFKTGELGGNCPSCGVGMQHCHEHQ